MWLTGLKTQCDLLVRKGLCSKTWDLSNWTMYFQIRSLGGALSWSVQCTFRELLFVFPLKNISALMNKTRNMKHHPMTFSILINNQKECFMFVSSTLQHTLALQLFGTSVCYSSSVHGKYNHLYMTRGVVQHLKRFLIWSVYGAAVCSIPIIAVSQMSASVCNFNFKCHEFGISS